MNTKEATFHLGIAKEVIFVILYPISSSLSSFFVFLVKNLVILELKRNLFNARKASRFQNDKDALNGEAANSSTTFLSFC